MKNILLISLVALSFSSMADDSDVEQKRRYQLLQERFENLRKNATIDIQGTVVDEQGNFLPNVQLNIQYSRPKDVWATEVESIFENMTIQDRFSINKNYYTSVTLLFSKEGYYTEKFTFFYSTLENTPETIPIQKNLTVILRKIGEVAKMKIIDSGFSCNTDNESDIINLITLKKEHKIKISDDITTPMLFFTISKDDNGQIITKKIEGWNNSVPASAFLELKSQSPTDGFILVDGINDLKEMKTAPLSGYNTKQISIDVTNANIGYIYFYVMINGYYGKGHITKRAFPNTLGTELRITLKIYLNVEDDDTKKRNVISPDNY